MPASRTTSTGRLRTARKPTRRTGSSSRSTPAPTSARPDDDDAAAPVVEGDQQQPDADDRPARPAAAADGAAPRGRAGGRRAAAAGHAGVMPAAPRARRPARRPRRRSAAASPGSSGPRRRGSARPTRPPRRRRAATSPAILPSTRLTPTSSTAAPGLTMSAVMMPGTPAAATTMSALRTCAARSRVPVWHSVTVAFSLRRVSSRPERAADGDAAADDDDLGAGDRHVVAAQQLDDADAACTAAAPASPSTSRPRLIGCRPSASLAGSIALEDARSRRCPRAAAAGRCSRCTPGRR